MRLAQSSTHIRIRFASDFDTRSYSALLPSRANICRRAVSRSNSISRCAPSRTIAARPADRREPLAACDLRDVMQRGRRIGDDASGRELDGVLAGRALDHQFAAVVARGIGQEQRERHVGAHALHQRIVDMAAVVHARLVAREHERGERLRPHRKSEHLVAEDALLDELAHGLDLAIVRRPAGCSSPVAPRSLRSRARPRRSRCASVSRTSATSSADKHVADHDLHGARSSATHWNCSKYQ